jgi:hypothetical protein
LRHPDSFSPRDPSIVLPVMGSPIQTVSPQKQKLCSPALILLPDQGAVIYVRTLQRRQLPVRRRDAGEPVFGSPRQRPKHRLHATAIGGYSSARWSTQLTASARPWERQRRAAARSRPGWPLPSGADAAADSDVRNGKSATSLKWSSCRVFGMTFHSRLAASRRFFPTWRR